MEINDTSKLDEESILIWSFKKMRPIADLSKKHWSKYKITTKGKHKDGPLLYLYQTFTFS